MHFKLVKKNRKITTCNWLELETLGFRSIVSQESPWTLHMCFMPRARSHLHLARPHPSHASFIARSSCPHLHGNSSSLGTNVTIPGHLSQEAPLACERTPSINLGIMKMMSTSIFVILTSYCHIGFQQGGVPMQVQARSVNNKEGVGGARPNWMKMWCSRGLCSHRYG